jgi:osmoprotectant transport system ATP-binding protein
VLWALDTFGAACSKSCGMIETRHLRKEFGARVAVHDVSLRVAAGEKLVLLGPSGCGKTTFLRMLNRLVEPTAGQVWFDNVNTAGINPVALRRRIGFVIQGAGLLPHRTVRENILTVPRLLGWTDEKCEESLFVMKALLWMFDDWFDVYPHELSAGQRQRVCLARALIAGPAAVLMDEPFSALDPVTRVQVRREFRALWMLRNKTVIMVTHDVSEAIEFADRIALMSAGRIEQMGTATDLLFRPKSEFVQKFFDNDRPHHEWQAVRLADLDLPVDWSDPDGTLTRLGLDPRLTVEEAMAAIGKDAARSTQLVEAFQDFKASAAAIRDPRPE